MSGLEGIAALGLACNVLQLIGTVATSITVARNIVKSGTSDPELEGRKDELTKLFQNVKASLSQVPAREDDKELRDVAEHILKTTAELKTEWAKMMGSPLQGKTQRIIGGTIKAFFRRPRLEKLEEKVLTYQKAFESRLLLSLRSRIDLGALQQKDDFARLDKSLQGFIKGLSSGHTKLEDLLKDQSSTLQTISTTMQAVVQSMDSGEKQRFLNSLRCDAMRTRFNRIEVAHSGTFEWIMWNCLNEDKDIYGEEGAKYLNLLKMDWFDSFIRLDDEYDMTHLRMVFATRPAIEFLENTDRGKEITKLDQTTLTERKLSLLIADFAIIKWKCDIERQGRFIAHKHSRGYKTPHLDLCI